MATSCEVDADIDRYATLLRSGFLQQARDLAIKLGLTSERRQELGLRPLAEHLLGGESAVRQMIREGRRDDLNSDRGLVTEGLRQRSRLGWPESNEVEFEVCLRHEFERFYDSVLCIVSD